MKVAVVGSGVSGLGATWLLNEHSDHEVHLYESDFRPGGHANTVHFLPKGRSWKQGVDVDTGFIVFNPSTYPNFLRFLQLFSPSDDSWWSRISSFFHLSTAASGSVDNTGICIDETEMTFSVSRDGGAFEWAGRNLATVFCQPRRLLDPQMWRMLFDILRFNACARRVLLNPNESVEEEMSIGEYLHRQNYSAAFRNNYLIPMTAAIWSTPPDKCSLDFPARTLIQFLYNHHLLQLTGKPSWLTIRGGSLIYINKIMDKLPQEQLHLSTPIISVRNAKVEDCQMPKVILTTEDGEVVAYDHVILACHSDTALGILRAGGIEEDEERILSQFNWSRNEVILHADERLMPRSRMAWSCWNYLAFTKSVPCCTHEDGYSSDTDSHDSLYVEREKATERCVKMEVNEVSLTYCMNELQHIPEARYGPVLATLNPPFEPAVGKIAGRYKYDHPVLDTKAIRAQNEMYKIQNKRSISYAGAYLKYGFHEDGFTSGLLAACSIDEGQNGLPSATACTSALTGTTIPTRNVTVRPPFEIKHADRHVQISQVGAENKIYVFAAYLLDWLEISGVRELIGTVGVFVLGILAWILGLPEL